jgi:hypothetical protein
LRRELVLGTRIDPNASVVIVEEDSLDIALETDHIQKEHSFSEEERNLHIDAAVQQEGNLAPLEEVLLMFQDTLMT